MKTTIPASELQPGDRFVGGTVTKVIVGDWDVRVEFGDSSAYYLPDDTVTIHRDDA